ncbi:baseplate wedge protein [Sporosarcina phage Lietuvens]|nr:baseplate wedge protein [Sporosarcina phage Lietuvens]
MAITPELFDEELADIAVEDVIITDEKFDPSKTFRLDFASGKLGRTIDGDEAFIQFIEKTLKTPRSRYLIYDDEYGNELESLIGQDLSQDLMKLEIPRIITESLIYDDRVEDVIEIEVEGISTDTVVASFTVIKTDGEYVDVEVIL